MWKTLSLESESEEDSIIKKRSSTQSSSISAGTSIAQSTSEDSIEQSISEDSNGDAIRTDTVSFKDSVEKKSVSVEPTRKER